MLAAVRNQEIEFKEMTIVLKEWERKKKEWEKNISSKGSLFCNRATTLFTKIDNTHSLIPSIHISFYRHVITLTIQLTNISSNS
jgi:hypothetical protein